jgi:hypothetical protein
MLKDDDDDSASSEKPGPSFELTGPTTDLTGDELRAFIDQQPILLGFVFNKNFRPEYDVPSFARRSSSDLLECARKRIGATDLSATGTMATASYDINLTKECDEEATPTDMVSELENQAKGRIDIACPGGDTQALKNSTIGQLTGDLIERHCGASRNITFKQTATSGARKATKEQRGSKTEVTDLKYSKKNFEIAAEGGAGCQFTATKKVTKIENCVLKGVEESFSGHPQFEKADLNDTTKETRPKRYLYSFSLKNVEQQDSDRYYRKGEVKFVVNGWKGAVKYTNGWAKPTWSAENGSQKIEDTHGANDSDNSENGDTKAPTGEHTESEKRPVQ